ncbi:MAG TPA: PTS sugar transporter subunit IIA [Anaeromyxobacter sp.]|nr:PTS sugar transporter subunit IIA [Anaeromyxobacter sp.]
MTYDLTSYLDPRTICLHLQVTDREEAIRLLGKRLEEGGIVKGSFAEAAIARERELPTGLPISDDINVAVPHTDPEHVLKPGLALGILDRPVEFASMDDPTQPLPVRVVFVMALAEREAQIDMLQSIVEVIQRREVLDAVVAARSPEEVLAALKQAATTDGATAGTT